VYVVVGDEDAVLMKAGSFAWAKTGSTILEKWESMCMRACVFV